MAISNDPPGQKRRRRVQRKRRRDAGSTRLRSRNVDILRFGAEQTFVRFDTIGEYLAPGYTPASAQPSPEQRADTSPPTKRPWPTDLRHRLMAVSHLMRRLETQSYVEIIQPWADQPAWFRVVSQGLRFLHLEWPEILFPDDYKDLEDRLRHDRQFTSHNHLINQVRLLLARGGAGVPQQHIWQGERAIEQLLPPREEGKHRPHKADGIVFLQEDGSWPILAADDRTKILATVTMKARQIIGIEVECTLKSDSRLHQIISDLLDKHDFVWYFCLTDTIYNAVAKARMEAPTPKADRRRLRILKLEDYLPCP